MRSARTLLAGAAVAAVLTVGTPMAFADGSSDQGKNLTWQEKQDKPDSKSPSDSSSKGYDDKKGGAAATEEHKGSDEHKGTEEHKGSEEHKGTEAKDEDHKAPHGGVHTGGGGLSLSGGGLASGAVLLLGGLGAGAFALRRGRRASGAIA
ncbi:hypothetical protein [Streptomyces sp. NRRL S-350]|uniref:hypothetical protein n=1 Tax=Streptomyces sp. NRRL S-350 TaxID=1463902 RepID=UPI0004C0C5F2|nr:hypothetical protein [Streptomyces sp. NRRL S-350]